MLQQRIYILYLIMGILFPVTILILDRNVVVNLYATFFVVVPSIAALAVFLLFFLYSVNYFLIRKYISSTFGLINLVFLILPLLYFFISQSPTVQDYEIHSNREEILTLITLPMFCVAILMLPISFTAIWWKKASVAK